MVAAGVSSTTKRTFAAFVASSSDGLRREVRADARRRGLPTGVDVDDAVQTAFVQLLPVYDALETEYAAFNYAHTTALRALSDARRRERVRHDGWLESVYRRTHRAVPDPEEEALRALRADDVRRAFRRLPDSQRRAIALVDVEELAQADAADVLGVSATTVKGLVQRGRESLRRDLRDLREVCGIAALVRFRRPSFAAPALTAPAVVAMAALVLTVAQAPAAPGPRRYDGGAAPHVTAVAAAAGPVATVPAARPAAPRSRPAPAARPRPARKAAPEPAAPRPRPKLAAAPAGACVGDLCAGRNAGDTVCVHGADRQIACATQAVVGLCPVAAPLDPVVTCARSADPLVEPVP